jgi:hypothetical protein
MKLVIAKEKCRTGSPNGSLIVRADEGISPYFLLLPLGETASLSSWILLTLRKSE